LQAHNMQVVAEEAVWSGLSEQLLRLVF